MMSPVSLCHESNPIISLNLYAVFCKRIRMDVDWCGCVRRVLYLWYMSVITGYEMDTKSVKAYVAE